MEQFKGQAPHLPLSTKDASEIRLVYVNLGPWDNPLECSLRNISLCGAEKDTASYFALSYVWGDPTHTRDITLNGSPFPITVNLFNALKRVRQSFREELDTSAALDGDAETLQLSIPLWIDAICINQLDLAERASQVTRMTDIYSKAVRVIAYIGDYHEGQEASVNLVFDLCNEVSDENAHTAFVKTLYQEFDHKHCSSSRMVLDALKQIYARPYFSRVWTVQETTVQFHSTVLMCGNKVTKLEYLKKLSNVKPISMAASHLEDSTFKAILMRNIACFSLAEYLEQNRPANMQDVAHRLNHLLSATGSRDATDQRDRLYGVLGLLGTDLPSFLKPSYEKPVEQIYYDYTRWLLEQTNDVTLLEGLPIKRTWAPSWVTDLEHYNAGNFEAQGLPYISSSKSGYQQPPFRFSDHGRTLHAHAMPLGVVMTVLRGLSTNPFIQEVRVELWFDAFETQIVQRLEIEKPDLSRDEILDLIFPTRLGLWSQREICKVALGQPWLSEEVLEELELRQSGLWGVHWFVLDDHSVWRSKYCNTDVPVEGDMVYLMIGSSHATVFRLDMETNTLMQVVNCLSGRLQDMLLDFSTEDWSEMQVEEILIS